MRSSCRVASASHAQGWRWTPDGGRVPGWLCTPPVGMEGGWDDNVLLVHPADRPTPDYASPTSPALSLDYGVLVPFARRRAYVDGRWSWFQNDPLAAGQPSLRTLSATGVLGYRAMRWLSAEANHVRTRQDSQMAGGQLARNQLGFGMVAARPIGLR
jgi:hypothetical protein